MNVLSIDDIVPGACILTKKNVCVYPEQTFNVKNEFVNVTYGRLTKAIEVFVVLPGRTDKLLIGNSWFHSKRDSCFFKALCCGMGIVWIDSDETSRLEVL